MHGREHEKPELRARRNVPDRYARRNQLTEAAIDVYFVDLAALLGTFEQVVMLAVLSLDDEAYGRAVLRGVQSNLDGTRGVTAGSVYATLDRLEAEGLLASRLEKGTAERKGRPRRFYRVTPRGVAAIAEVRTTLLRMWRGAKLTAEVRG